MNNKVLWQTFKKNLALLNKDNFTEFQDIVKYIIENLNPSEIRDDDLKYFDFQIREIKMYFLNWSSDWEEYVKDKDTEDFQVFINNGNHLFEINEIKVNIQGFTCIFIDASEDQIDGAIAKIERALKRINGVAKKYFPLVLKHKVPLYFSFDKTTFCLKPEKTHLNYEFLVNGCYIPTKKVIEILYTKNINPFVLCGTIGHELGHHLFRNYLSDEARQFWYDIINGLTENKTIRQVFGESDNYVKTIIDTFKTTKTLSNYQDIQEKMLFVKKFEQDLDIVLSGIPMDQVHYLIYQNLDTPIRVHKNPMTVYAHSNPEEAFCEFLRVLLSSQLFMIDRSWIKYFETTMGTRIQNKLANNLFISKDKKYFKKGY